MRAYGAVQWPPVEQTAVQEAVAAVKSAACAVGAESVVGFLLDALTPEWKEGNAAVVNAATRWAAHWREVPSVWKIVPFFSIGEPNSYMRIIM